MKDKFTVRQFNYRFPTEDACLEEIKVLRFGEVLPCPRCGVINKFHKLTGRKAYSCSACRHQIYPLAGTIFEKSTTPLKDWFYAIYLMTQTRAGISAKQLERMLGVTYKTAWRMFHQIRKLMADDGDMLIGDVEIDEAYFHPNPQRRTTAESHNSQIVLGMVERKGRAVVKHVRSSGTRVLVPEVMESVSIDSQIYTDGYRSYKQLVKNGYNRKIVNHSTGEYVNGLTHTQNVENLWSNIKRGIYGVYRHVDPKYLQAYVDEYAFRYSNRGNTNMFDALINKIV